MRVGQLLSYNHLTTLDVVLSIDIYSNKFQLMSLWINPKEKNSLANEFKNGPFIVDSEFIVEFYKTITLGDTIIE